MGDAWTSSRGSHRPGCARLLSTVPLAVIALLLGAAPAAALTLTRGPYLQLLTETGVTVGWNTDTPSACSLAIHPVGDVDTIIPGPTATVCAIPVTGLTPATTYGYVPSAGGVALTAESTFRTDDPSAPFSFQVIGDTGCACANEYAVRDRMLATPADFVLSVGDMIYESGLAQDFDPKFFAPYRDLLRRLVFWPTLGNHDVVTAGGQPWRDAFYTPANNPAASESYYSFDFGNAHVAVIDSNAATAPGSAQYVFLDQDLAASSATWKFVAFHHTIYSASSGHGSNLPIRANLRPLFDQRHVDVVFMGHDHDYERTHPLVADQIVPAGQGTVYVTTGGGGRELYGAGQSTFTAYSESVFHFMSPTRTPTPAATSAGAVDLAPIADTYIEAGTEQTWDHGISDHMDVDLSPRGIAYLAFDLRGVTGPVTSATLMLWCTNSSNDGGTVYPVADASWIEGSRTGIDATSANGPGLEWIDVDTNRDGAVDGLDASPYVPDGHAIVAIGAVTSNRAVTVDLTAAFQQGARIYALAIRSASSDGATYSSREHPTAAQRPRLHVSFAAP